MFEEMGHSNDQADDPLLLGQTSDVDLHGKGTELNNGNLSNDDDDPDAHEHWVGEDAREDIDLIMDLSGSEHVEDLEKHEQVEHN